MWKRMFLVLFVLSAGVCTSGLLAGDREILLWPKGAPGSDASAGPSKMEAPNKDHDTVRVTEVHKPSLTVFLPSAETATGAAMIIAPGGGHRFLSWDSEGTNVAKYLCSIGVASFVLQYRLAKEPNSKYRVEVEEVADTRRAIRLVRERAAEFHVDPARVGVMGFSAGGELAALVSTKPEAGDLNSADPVETFSSRPDFDALIYPGGNASDWTITKDTPPTFLLCADDDKGPSQNIATLFAALKQNGVPVEVHVYAKGGHGFGLREHPAKPTAVNTTWHLRLGEWLKTRGYLEKK